MLEVALHGFDLLLQARPGGLLSPDQLLAEVGQLRAPTALQAHQRPANGLLPLSERAPDMAIREPQALGRFRQRTGSLYSLEQAEQERVSELSFGSSDAPVGFDLNLDHMHVRT